MAYLDGIFHRYEWGNSERMMAAIIPAKGEVKYVGPHFEEERIRELLVVAMMCVCGKNMKARIKW